MGYLLLLLGFKFQFTGPFGGLHDKLVPNEAASKAEDDETAADLLMESAQISETIEQGVSDSDDKNVAVGKF